MTATDALWDGIAARTPRLRAGVRVNRHRYRGERWYVLHDPVTSRWHRIDARAWQLVRLLDGECAVETAATAAGLTAAEATRVLDTLQQAELMDWDTVEDSAALHARARRARRNKRVGQLLSPVSFRLPLLDPDKLLDRHRGLARLVFSGWGALVLAGLVTAALLASVTQWPAITGYWSGRGVSAHAFVLIPLVYVVMKTLHELAHALAVKRWGGEVHDLGLVFILLLPIPYVDASGAWAFPHRRRRMIVSAAGILAELGLAALATLAFLTIEAGIVKDFAFTAMLLGSVSTVLFNGNPLLRFDGYYVLADAVEIPNLGPRSSRYWIYLAQRYLLALDDAASPVAARGERRWFIAYGLAATLYRIGIVLSIALLLAAAVPALGFALALWVLLGQLGLPLLRAGAFVARSPRLAGRRREGLVATTAALLAVLLPLVAVPLPLSTRAEGIVWLPERSYVRAGADGTIAVASLTEHDQVEAGDLLLRLENPLLEARLAALRWELREVESRRDAARVNDPVQVQVLADSVARLRADIASLEADIASFAVRAPTGGRVIVPGRNVIAGRYVHKGDVLAYVLEDTAPRVRVAVPQRDAGQLRGQVEAVHVRLSDAPARSFDAAIELELPAADQTLPSVALGAAGGGRIAIDPADEAQLRAIDRIFLIDLVLPEHPPVDRVGGRAWVRFEHGREPVAMRLYRSFQALLLTRLSV